VANRLSLEHVHKVSEFEAHVGKYLAAAIAIAGL
jgi:hypothetical protein